MYFSDSSGNIVGIRSKPCLATGERFWSPWLNFTVSTASSGRSNSCISSWLSFYIQSVPRNMGVEKRLGGRSQIFEVICIIHSSILNTSMCHGNITGDIKSFVLITIYLIKPKLSKLEQNSSCL